MSTRWWLVGVVVAAVLACGANGYGQKPSEAKERGRVAGKGLPQGSSAGPKGPVDSQDPFAAKPAAGDPFAAPAVAADEATKDVQPKPGKARPSAKPSAGARPAAQAKAKSPDLRTGEAAILTALEEKASFDFAESPLQDVIDYIESAHHIAILLDKKAMDEVGITSDTPITKIISNVSLRSALDLVLHDLDLTWMIHDEVLTITTPDEANIVGLTTRVYEVPELIAVRDKNGTPWDDADGLIELITSAIEPDTWDEVGGPGSIVPWIYPGAKVLVVRQTRQVHEELARLLDDLRAVAAPHKDHAEPPIRERRKEEKFRPTGGLSGGNTSGKEKQATKDDEDDDKPSERKEVPMGGFF